ncbi:MAG: class D beta-lactamase [Magnetococcus sp. DMHC-1]|nr:class D beta-lactamase [Magnetococcales bacterium]
MKNCLFGLMIGLFFTALSCQAETELDSGLTHILQQAGVAGSIVLLETDTNRVRVSDTTRSQERFLPASTFKVPHALIALETGVVQENELFPWDGTPLPLKTWEKDLTLKEAMAVSSVPVFQQIARRIGLQRLAEWVTRIGYGNHEIGEKVDQFWLEGPLAISPLEQAQFMARLAQNQLPFAKQSLESVRRLIPQEQLGDAHLFGKTGWAAAAKPMIGWYVGWLETQGTIVAFAVNIPMQSLEDAPLRKSLAMTALRYSGALATM